jgi:hypothetical protein
MNGLDKLHKGNFNDMSQEHQSDGSIKITLSKRGEDKVYKFRVRNLYQPNEEELDYDTGQPIAQGNLLKAMPGVQKESSRSHKRKTS